MFIKQSQIFKWGEDRKSKIQITQTNNKQLQQIYRMLLGLVNASSNFILPGVHLNHF